MARERVRFGVDLDRKTDGDFAEVARKEHRSKRNMHAVVVQRVLRLWRERPDTCKELKLIVPLED